MTATIIRFPRRPKPPSRPGRVQQPLRKTPARARWLGLIAAGSVTAAPCRVVVGNSDTTIWYPRGDRVMAKWLGTPEVRALWTPGHRFGALEPTWVLRLTAEGKALLATWERDTRSKR